MIKYHIKSLTKFDSENASETGIPEIPQAILDEYIPYQPNYKPGKHRLLLTPNAPFPQLISWDEIEINEPTAANQTSSGLQLTNLTAGIHSSQDLRPVAVVNPLYMHQPTIDNQTNQTEGNVDGSSSLAERKRERRRVRGRQRYQTDPAYAEHQRERQREYKKGALPRRPRRLRQASKGAKKGALPGRSHSRGGTNDL
ncbi:hypothetical protein [Endozoicomonas sp. GU-1]|uniref:hypothetical protein n=1 Tax=Endozoicomonas sp. GU-1 TaxID=3009078 RepID=UPI0022B49021|nr:hypothetical protein [Endozoicomonas sp. GU-1]WBA79726.1 hypothetical protein O2T12_15290 [Endozoicomonas sp. GU-1]WBA87311.1 hypothetical protein O3276_04560 [Endozoicomonas sp. GU-1]